MKITAVIFKTVSLKSPITWFPCSFILAHSTPVDMPSRGQNEDRDSGIARSGTCTPFIGLTNRVNYLQWYGSWESRRQVDNPHPVLCFFLPKIV